MGELLEDKVGVEKKRLLAKDQESFGIP